MPERLREPVAPLPVPRKRGPLTVYPVGVGGLFNVYGDLEAGVDAVIFVVRGREKADVLAQAFELLEAVEAALPYFESGRHFEEEAVLDRILLAARRARGRG